MTKSSKDKLIAPFVTNCYAMVDDPATDPIISWSSTGRSFVIWDVVALEKELIPKYYRHNNFQSFVRQLNQYGFTKYDHDRWEFANSSFIKGQKHMLTNIIRKKSSQPKFQQNQSQVTNPSAIRKPPQGALQQIHSQIKKASQVSNSQPNKLAEKNTSLIISEEEEDLSQENDSSLVWEEVEILKKDKNVVMQELAKISHHQQGADTKLHCLTQQLEGMEISQQQMMSFLVTVMQDPGFMGQLLQQNESPWRSISETNKKRPFLALEQGSSLFDELMASSNQIVQYQPLKAVTPKPKPKPMPKPKPLLMLPSNSGESTQQLDTSANGLDEFFKNIDLMSSGPADDNQNGGQFVIPDSVDDGMLDTLLASPKSDTADSKTLSQLAAELGILIPELNNEDEGASSNDEDKEI